MTHVAAAKSGPVILDSLAHTSRGIRSRSGSRHALEGAPDAPPQAAVNEGRRWPCDGCAAMLLGTEGVMCDVCVDVGETQEAAAVVPADPRGHCLRLHEASARACTKSTVTVPTSARLRTSCGRDISQAERTKPQNDEIQKTIPRYETLAGRLMSSEAAPDASD